MLQQRHVAVVALSLFILGLGLPAAASPGIQPAAPACAVVVKNGNFEDLGANWTQSGAGSAQLITDFNPRTGNYAADLGGVNTTNHSIKQQITLPERRPLHLLFWWEQRTQESVPGAEADYLSVRLVEAGSAPQEVVRLGADPDRPPWQRLAIDISAYSGQTVELELLAHNDSSNPTRFFVDDVIVTPCHAYLPVLRR